jgi:hypothetical protein
MYRPQYISMSVARITGGIHFISRDNKTLDRFSKSVFPTAHSKIINKRNVLIFVWECILIYGTCSSPPFWIELCLQIPIIFKFLCTFKLLFEELPYMLSAETAIQHSVCSTEGKHRFSVRI